MLNLEAIPTELKGFRAWIVWRNVTEPGSFKPSKKPYHPITGRLCDPTDPSQWSTFEVASSVAARYDGLGFCLSDADPYTVIDLDNPGDDADIIAQHTECVSRFASYTEISPSGQGAHIWIRGSIPAGRRRNKLELYSNERYMTVTGNVWADAPIAERQELLTDLFNRMGVSTLQVYDAAGTEQTEDDLTVYNIAANAANGEQFVALWNGDLTGYPSQSEADQALTNLLQFYTKNREQIKRMFMQSALGQRKKASRKDYVDRNITKAFDNETPLVDLDDAANQMREVLAAKARAATVGASDQWAATQAPAPDEPAPSAASVYGVPPGILGEVAQFIYQAAPRPVAEIALTGAIGFLAGVTGRAYNISGSGLNQYVLLLAPSGIGKDAISSGINALIQAMTASGCGVSDEYLGPSMLPSGQGLIRHLSKKKSCVSVIGEFGLRMQRMMNKGASSSEIALKQLLLDLYGKSGRNGVLGSSAYSDSDKNVEAIRRPAYSIIGESTQSEFYKSIDEASFASGLIPRFTVIEYEGQRPGFNVHRLTEVPAFLAKTLADIGAHAMTTNVTSNPSQSCIDFTLSAEAEAILQSFLAYTDQEWNRTQEDAGHEVWSRAWLKAAKLAALASFDHSNWKAPTVTGEAAQWACAFVDFEVRKTLETYHGGKLGQSATFDTEQLEHLKKQIGKYIAGEIKPGAYEQYRNQGCITKSWIDQHCAPYACFKNDRLGANAATKKIVMQLVEHGALEPLNLAQVKKQFNSTAHAYAISNINYFLQGEGP